jgi:hypothetical protein
VTDEVTIRVEERDALYEHLLSHLTGLDDLRGAFERKDFELAKRLGIEFGDELRLLEDIGWGFPEVEDLIKVTMPPGQRHRLFSWLREGIESLRRDEEREEAEFENDARDQRERASCITDACNRVLGAATRGY